jgi:hypothetical protein
MAANDNSGGNRNPNREVYPRTASYAGKHPELAGDMPAGFRAALSPRRAFNDVREHTGRGSEMIRRDKPFPELRPEDEQAPIREAFNRAWLREQREARLADLERQREERRMTEQAERAKQLDYETKAHVQHAPER